MRHEFKQTDADFETTDWTFIDVLRGDVEGRQGEAIEALIRSYWPPVYAWLRQNGHNHHEAAELTQSFFHEIVLERLLFERADESRGLRNLIRAALRNHVIDHHRRRARQPAGRLIPDAALRVEQSAFSGRDETTPDQLYDQRWALACLEQAIEECERLYRAAGRLDYWQAFEARVLRPARHQNEPSPRAQLADQLGFTDESHVSVAVHMVKQRLQALLRQVVARTVDDPEECEAEFRLLCRLLS